MNKIIDTQCECCNTDTILKIVAGNDFTLRLALTYHEDDVVKEYDLSDIQDLKVIAYSPEGVDREVDSMVDIATNRIIAVIDSYEYINYVPYGIDITWYDEPNHKRASAPNLFAFVNSSGEANDSQDVIVSGPYDYNLEIKSDIAYVSVGEIPDVDLTEYVTNSSLNTTLQNYESKKELETTLQYYATKKYVDDAMLDIDLSDYYTKSEVDTTLQNYGTSLSSGTKIISGPTVGMDISLNSDTQTLSTLTIPSFQKNINSSVPKGWVISPVTSIGFVSRSTVETIYDTEDRVATIESDYITSTSLNTTLQNYESKKELETTLQYYATKKYVDDAMLDIDLSDYVTNTSLNTTLQDYVTNSALNTSLNPITSDITSLDNRVTTLENNPQVPSNVVTSDDGNEIVCLTQSEYDALEQAQTLDPDVFYYITDTTSNYVTNSSLNTTLSDYATKKYVDTAVSQVQPDTSNLVTLNSSQTISGQKTFSASNRFTNETKFENTDGTGHLGNFVWIDSGVYKSSLFTRAEMDQLIVGQIMLPQVSESNSSSSLSISPNTLTFNTITSIPNPSAPTLQQVAAITDQGIYEGTTLLSDKYALKSEIPTSSGVSEEDWDNSNEAIAKELANNRLEHLSINDKFNDYYTKSEADGRYATASWANNKFVTKTDDVNRQEAIAATFAYLQTAIDESGGSGSEIDLSSYVTIDEMNNYSEVVSTALTNNKLDIININDKFNDYYTKSQADNRYVTPNAVAQKYVSNSSFDNLSNVVASSLNDLNDRIPSNTSDLTNDSGFVTSTSVHNIWTGSQSDYDQLTPEADTLYIII